MIPRPILHELAFLVTFMGWLAVAIFGHATIATIAILVATGYATWWVVR
jgi:hypothetical protein